MGGGGGENGAGIGVKGGGGKRKVKAPSKANCMVCKMTTNRVPSNREGSLQCGVCDGWWHSKCAQLSDELFEMISKWTQSGQACERASAKLLKMVSVLST